MSNLILLLVGVVLAVVFVIYTIFWRCKLHSESEGMWFIVYALIPVILLLGSISLMYFGIRGLV